MKLKFVRISTLAAVLSAMARLTFAQTGATYYSGSNPNTNYLYSASIGNVPNYGLSYSHTYMGLNVRPGAGGSGWLTGTDNANNGGAMLIGSIGGDLTFVTIPTANAGNAQSLTDAQVVDLRRMQILANGQVRIGKTQPTTQTDYKLSVEGKLVAQSMYVTAPSSWADFVFAPTYKPMSLPLLENYLVHHKHLPAIPSASEIESKGYNVTDMDAKLLQSIEELTLHVIALSKEVEKLKAEKIAAGKSN